MCVRTCTCVCMHEFQRAYAHVRVGVCVLVWYILASSPGPLPSPLNLGTRLGIYLSLEKHNGGTSNKNYYLSLPSQQLSNKLTQAQTHNIMYILLTVRLSLFFVYVCNLTEMYSITVKRYYHKSILIHVMLLLQQLLLFMVPMHA